jgi:hypothetical protein
MLTALEMLRTTSTFCTIDMFVIDKKAESKTIPVAGCGGC